ncbi:MAG: hypothetical protein KTR25_13975 [Myxococcales bacterium]|nr:hypothetical protein [Myxococcales bacterium]
MAQVLAQTKMIGQFIPPHPFRLTANGFVSRPTEIPNALCAPAAGQASSSFIPH